MNNLQELEKKVLSLPEMAKEIVITNDDQLYKGNQFLLLIKNKQKEINSVFDPMIQKAHEAHKEALSQKKKFENPLREAEGYLKSQIAPYLAEKERIRREAELKAQREREEAERKAREEEERKLQEAIKAEEEGRIEEAEEILNEEVAEPILKEQIVPEKTKLEGTFLRRDWKWRASNMEDIPREYLKLDDIKINQVVRSLKEKAVIPGIEVYYEDNVTSRGSR